MPFGMQQGTSQVSDGARGGVAGGVGVSDGVGIGIGGAPGGAVQSVSNADVLFVNPQRPRSPLGGGGPAGADEPPVLCLARNSRLTLKEEREAADRWLRVQNTVCHTSYDTLVYSSAKYV